MRLNKYISDSGECSRREADERIAAGRVSVNGEVASVGSTIADGDTVLLDGQPLRARRVAGGRRHVYIALHKPAGVTCTTDTQIKGNIIDFVGHQQRIFPIGRLDKEPEGPIRLTKDRKSVG